MSPKRMSTYLMWESLITVITLAIAIYPLQLGKKNKTSGIYIKP